MICPDCKTLNADAARFCNSCGVTLSRSHSTADAETVAMTSDVTAQATPINKDPLIGRSIDGRYRLDSLIGRGGMGAVYCATRLLIGDEVAIKILHTEQVGDPHAAERFRREARAAARLKHPNAVSIYDFGVSGDGLQFLVMELVEGKSLREFTRAQGPLDPSLVAEITSQICAALDEAHRQHIVHRDIKPDNIIVNFTPAGLRIKVLDFGIAKLRDDTTSHLTQTGSVMGTPHYMSPEQCLGEELDSRADIYSVGVVVYELLCGRVPFNSPISTAVVVQHVNQPPPSLRAINPAIMAEVEAVVFHALEKSRYARPPTAGALAQELLIASRRPAFQVAGSVGRLAPAIISPQQDRIPDEQTIERRAGDYQPAPTAMPATIHMESPKLGVPLLGADVRNTAGNSAIETLRLKRSRALKYGSAVLATIVVASLIGILFWSIRPDEGSRTSGATSAAGSAAGQGTSGEPATLAPVNSDPAAGGKLSTIPAQMVLVNGERFLMGSSEGDADSKPSHMVVVKSFYLDVNEVTCEDYKKFIDATGHPAPKTWINGKYPSGTAQLPVTSVSWEEAVAYAQWARKRLPTEEEWELAARGREGLRYPWGNSWQAGCANADAEGQARKRLASVGSHDCASPFGAKDLIGNAWEWTASDWMPYPGGQLQRPTTGGEKVIRGGGWDTPRNIATATYRSGWAGPGDKTGFRCAQDAQ
jgi:serine/threonine-protein kinase